MKQNVIYLKKLTLAEVGETKAHVGGYIRLPNDFDYVTFFQTQGENNNGVTEISFNAYNCNKGKTEENLRFAYFANSNKERRIPNLANLFKENEVEAGDIVKLESRQMGGDVEIQLSFYKNKDITTSATNIYYICVDDDFVSLKQTQCDNISLQQIYYGAPGTGKSFEVRQQVEKLTKQKDDENNPYVFRTTFHPDYDYASFVGCYKPTMQGNDIIYSFIAQTFTNAYIKAWVEYKKDEQKPVCLVIEEINRGNCAQIFGDIFQLLDRKNGFSESPINADKDLCDYLNGLVKKNELPSEAIKNNKLQLPSNLYILATMNTSDQSLFPMDSAFKRRWNWKYTPIVNANKGFQIDIDGAKYSWWKFVEKINGLIFDKIESEDKKLGYFFAGNNPSIDADCFVSKVLFYLWNDVFKDADLDGTPFQNHSFYSLFNDDGTIKTEEVMSLLGDEPLNLEWESRPDEPVVDETKIGKDNTKYSINGEGIYAKKTIPFTIISLISEQSQCTFDELKSKWSDFSISFLYSEEEYNQRKQESVYKGFENVYNCLTLQNGTKVYILSNCWDKVKIERFIDYVNKKFKGIKIEALQ